MTLDEFRALDQDAKLFWVANVILGQNGRLRRGDDMTGPVMVVVDGKRVDGSSATDATELDPETFMPKGQKTITAFSMTAKLQQVLDYHPWLDIKVGDCNFLHMYEVHLVSPFGEKQPGEEIDVEYDRRVRLKTTLTKEQIDDNTSVIIRYGLSK